MERSRKLVYNAKTTDTFRRLAPGEQRPAAFGLGSATVPQCCPKREKPGPMGHRTLWDRARSLPGTQKRRPTHTMGRGAGAKRRAHDGSQTEGERRYEMLAESRNLMARIDAKLRTR